MALIVQKFGGTSVADIERIKNVANRVEREVDEGNNVIVVVSAMAGVTNQLDGWVREISDLNNESSKTEYDVVVSSGEQVTAGLLALTLQAMDIKAKTMLGSHIPIKTDETFAKARIESVDCDSINEAIEKGNVIIVPGFQGITSDGHIATLGRGGSDTSAVAIAAALKADRCDIYTDVDGVYTTDPRLAPKARKLNKIGYEEVLEMASLGAKVLQTRSVEMAMKYSVPVQVRSSFSDDLGTLLVDEDEIMERRLITGIAYSRNDAQITLVDVENTPGVAADIFGPLADAEINVDMIVQNISEDGKETNVTFTIEKADLQKAIAELENANINCKSILTNTEVSKISVIGVGMRSHAGLAQRMFKTLADNSINIHVISTSEIKISVLVDEKYLELALRELHTAYELDN